MNYIPLYRKYRPQKLEELVGQEHIKTALKNAIELDKISHAYLFTGPRGTGKTSTARIFAKSLNCKEGPTVSPCGVCENCIDITNSTPMDVIEIDAASNRKVEDAQNILEKVMYAPVNSRFKIYIIDEVHMLSTTAFNALLKTLEEPPKNVIFILATTEVHKVLDTIKSRCQRFDFKRITTDDIVKHLRFISDSEKIKITDDALYTIAKNSAGGMRDSIALLDQLSVLDNEITTDDINNLLGRLSFDTLNSLTEKLIFSKHQEAIQQLEKIYNSGNEPVQILTNLMDFLKNLLIVKNCEKDIALDITQLNDIQISSLIELSKNIETHQIVFLIDKCSEYIKELKLTNNPRLWLEVAIIDLANLTVNTKLIELQNRIISLEKGTASHVTTPISISKPNIPSENVASYKTSPAPVSKPEIMKPVAKSQSTESVQKNSTETEQTSEEFSPMPKSKPVEGADLEALWSNLLSNIQSPPTRALLKQWGAPVKVSPEETILTMKNEIFLNQVQNGSKKQSIIQALDVIFSQTNSNLIIRLPEPGDDTVRQVTVVPVKPVKTQKPDKVSEPEPALEEIQEIINEVNSKKESPKIPDAVVGSDNAKLIMDLFDGKIIE